MDPVILIVTTQTWVQVTRMAVRFSHYGCRVSALCPAKSDLRFFERLHTCHTFQPGASLHSLETAIERSAADYLVPGDDLAVWLLHELSERTPKYRNLVERSLGPARSFATVRSRFGLLSLAIDLGIEVPETAIAHTINDAEAWNRGRTLPFLVKKDGTFAGGGVELVNDLADLPHHYARLNAGPTRWESLKQSLLPVGKPIGTPFSWISEPEVSVQAYVEGVAANAMFACDKGRILGSVQARVIAAKSKTGPAVMISLLNDERMERAGHLLASSLQLSGFFGLDFILQKDTGVPYLIEMNPRCTQMGHVALANQADLAGLLWSEWSGETTSEVGNRELAPSICFYPIAMQWMSGSSFLERARPDVCAEDREIVDRLAKGNPALLARSYRAAREQLKLLKHSVTPPAPAQVHYFESAALPNATMAAQKPFTPNYPAVSTGGSRQLGPPSVSPGAASRATSALQASRAARGGSLTAPPHRA